MQRLLALPFIGLLTVSCAGTPVIDNPADGKTKQTEIESVIFIKSTPPLAASQRRDQTLTVNKDLSTHFEVKDGYNKLLNEKAGTITKQQFKTLTDKLNALDYIRLRTTRRSEPLPGSPGSTLIVKSGRGAHRLVDGATTIFPEGLQEVFDMHTVYLSTTSNPVIPKEPEDKKDTDQTVESLETGETDLQ